MTELLNLIGNPYFWGLVFLYWFVSAAVGALEAPGPDSSPFYRWFFKFSNTFVGNVTRAFSSKIPGINGGNGGK